MPVEGARSREAILKEVLAALSLGVVYVGAEFFWDLLGGEASLERFALAMVSAIGTWLVVRATIPRWPLAQRLILCLAMCAALNGIAELRVYEHMSRFGAVHAGSDDSFYLKSGSQFANMLRDTGDLESYVNVYASLPFTPHIGFIVLLGHLFLMVPADDLSQLRMVVLLNAFAVQWLAALVIRLGQFAPRNLGLVLLLFLVPGFDLIYFAGEVRKDPIIVLLIVALMARMLDLAVEKTTLRRLGALLAIATALFFMRNFYVVLPVGAMILTRLRDQQGSPLRRMIARTVALGGLGGVLYLVANSMWFQELSLTKVWSMQILERGWGAQIYNFPAIGPFVYALITPLPPRLIELAGGTMWTDLLRTMAMVAILVLLVAQGGMAIRSRAAADKRWRTFFHLGVVIFLLSAYGSLEPRHRISALPCIFVCYGIARQRDAAAGKVAKATGDFKRVRSISFRPAVSNI